METPAYSPSVEACPKCGHSLQSLESLVVEYWSGEHTIYFCWCHKCKWKTEVKFIDRIITTEVEES
jgi:C4-type Zn-finger protein